VGKFRRLTHPTQRGFVASDSGQQTQTNQTGSSQNFTVEFDRGSSTFVAYPEPTTMLFVVTVSLFDIQIT